MPKRNQIIANQAGRKTQAKEALMQVYHPLQKRDLLSGISRTYKPKDETGAKQPTENKLVPLKVGEVIDRVTRKRTELFGAVVTQDWTNCAAQTGSPPEIKERNITDLEAERKIEHAGVAGHPGDKGMKAIADELFAAIRQESRARRKVTSAEVFRGLRRNPE